MAFLVGDCVCSICGFEFVAILPVDEGQKWEPSMECTECGNMAVSFVRDESPTKWCWKKKAETQYDF